MRKLYGMYEKKGVPKPEGKGIHTVKFHKVATGIMESMKKSGNPVDKNIAYATAMKKLGRNKSVLAKSRK